MSNYIMEGLLEGENCGLIALSAIERISGTRASLWAGRKYRL